MAAFGGTLDLSDDLAGLIRKQPVDLVVAESWRTGLAAFRAVRLQEVPLVVARTAGAAHPWDVHGLDEPPPGPALEPRLASLALRCLSRTPADSKAWLEAGVGHDAIWHAPPPLGRDFGSSVSSRQPVLAARDADRLAPFIHGSPARPFRLSVLSSTLRPRMGWSGGVRTVPAGATRRRVELLRRAGGVVVDRSPLDIRLAREALACGCPTWVLASDGVNLQQARVHDGELDVFGAPVSPARAVTGAAAPLDPTEDGSSDLLTLRMTELISHIISTVSALPGLGVSPRRAVRCGPG